MRCAVVTGASRGIGREIARQLAASGCQVAALARDAQALENLAAETAHTRSFPCDLTDWPSTESALARIRAELGDPAILINNAGLGGPFHTIAEATDRDWDAIFHINARAPFWLCRALLPAMRGAGFGRIVNIASVEGTAGAAESANYVAAKHALIGYTRAIAAEWGRFGVTCNAICPGLIKTGMAAGFGEEKARHRIPVGRFGSPEEVARVAVFLASEASGYVNGSVIAVDGGLSADLGIPR